VNREAYDAARAGAVVVDRSDRGLVRVHGRDPVRMVHGLASNDVESLAVGRATYATLLTARGRLIADPRIIRRDSDLLLEADAGAVPDILETFTRFVPPLFARAESQRGELCVIGVYGPASTSVLARLIDVRVPEAVPAGDDAVADSHTAADTANRIRAVPADDATTGTWQESGIVLIRTAEAGVEGWDLVVACDRKETLLRVLRAAGAMACDLSTIDVLRIEAGSPRWGAELTGDIIPLEAGLKERAISTTKGCYTGQEVIIRILHRGHVNRHLRGLRMSGPPALPGTELFHPSRPNKSSGAVTSAAASPRLGSVALAYVRREIEPGDTVHLGAPDGPQATVVFLPFDDS
jgi:folate-binding protein YgfZ